MELWDCLDFNAIGDAGAFEDHTFPTEYTQIVSDLEQHASEGSVVAVKRSIGALRRTGVGQRWLECPGSALYLAILHSHTNIVDYLLSEGVQISSNHVKCATEKRNKAILGLLVDHGWDINQQIEWSVPPALA